MRNYGQTLDCAGCRFWSEMVAQSIGGAPVEALCLSADGPYKGKYVTGKQTCESWRSGHNGAVDEPPDYGETVRELYEAEERGELEVPF
jgi:hypothetical protein